MKLNTVLPAIILLALLPGCSGKYDELNLSVYMYRDTRNLVRFVYDAVCIVETEGDASIEYFRDNRNDYCSEDYYLYIYDMNATNLFHAGMPYFEGRNLRDISDINGKKIFDMICEALEDTCNPHAWVHYSWWEPGCFYPVPKSSCHFRVSTPQGEEFIVGGGLNYPPEEKEFARIIVDIAVELIEREGENAIDFIDNPTSIYNFREVRIFAFRPDNRVVISPVVEDIVLQVDLLDVVDRAGNRPFALAVQQLENRDRVWQVFMVRNRYERQLEKKAIYLRETVLSGETLFIGAITDLPMTP